MSESTSETAPPIFVLSTQKNQSDIGASKVMTGKQSNNPLHGITLAKVVTSLVERYGWDGMAQRININCFKSDPSIKSSLKFLRKTQWARDEVEDLYIATFVKQSPWNKTKKAAREQ